MDDPKLPSVFDEDEDLETAIRLDAEAEADVAAARVVPHEKVAEWLDKLARGERVAPPNG